MTPLEQLKQQQIEHERRMREIAREVAARIEIEQANIKPGRLLDVKI